MDKQPKSLFIRNLPSNVCDYAIRTLFPRNVRIPSIRRFQKGSVGTAQVYFNTFKDLQISYNYLTSLVVNGIPLFVAPNGPRLDRMEQLYPYVSNDYRKHLQADDVAHFSVSDQHTATILAHLVFLFAPQCPPVGNRLLTQTRLRSSSFRASPTPSRSRHFSSRAPFRLVDPLARPLVVTDGCACTGGDAITLAAEGSWLVQAVECDRTRCDMLAHNARVLLGAAAEMFSGDTAQWTSQLGEEVASRMSKAVVSEGAGGLFKSSSAFGTPTTVIEDDDDIPIVSAAAATATGPGPAAPATTLAAGALGVVPLCGPWAQWRTRLQQDVVFFDPPWGGRDYLQQARIALTLGDESLGVLVADALRSGARLVVVKAPNNSDEDQLLGALLRGEVDVSDPDEQLTDTHVPPRVFVCRVRTGKITYYFVRKSDPAQDEPAMIHAPHWPRFNPQADSALLDTYERVCGWVSRGSLVRDDAEWHAAVSRACAYMQHADGIVQWLQEGRAAEHEGELAPAAAPPLTLSPLSVLRTCRAVHGLPHVEGVIAGSSVNALVSIGAARAPAARGKQEVPAVLDTEDAETTRAAGAAADAAVATVAVASASAGTSVASTPHLSDPTSSTASEIAPDFTTDALVSTNTAPTAPAVAAELAPEAAEVVAVEAVPVSASAASVGSAESADTTQSFAESVAESFGESVAASTADSSADAAVGMEAQVRKRRRFAPEELASSASGAAAAAAEAEAEVDNPVQWTHVYPSIDCRLWLRADGVVEAGDRASMRALTDVMLPPAHAHTAAAARSPRHSPAHASAPVHSSSDSVAMVAAVDVDDIDLTLDPGSWRVSMLLSRRDTYREDEQVPAVPTLHSLAPSTGSSEVPDVPHQDPTLPRTRAHPSQTRRSCSPRPLRRSASPARDMLPPVRRNGHEPQSSHSDRPARALLADDDYSALCAQDFVSRFSGDSKVRSDRSPRRLRLPPLSPSPSAPHSRAHHALSRDSRERRTSRVDYEHEHEREARRSSRERRSDKHRDDTYREDKYREAKRREDKYREDKHREDKYREDRHREDKYREDRHREAKRREDKHREDKYREDKYREDKYREDKYREDKHRSGDRHREDKYHDDRHREERHREEKHREDRRRDGERPREDKHREDKPRERRDTSHREHERRR